MVFHGICKVLGLGAAMTCSSTVLLEKSLFWGQQCLNMSDLGFFIRIIISLMLVANSEWVVMIIFNRDATGYRVMIEMSEETGLKF